MSDNRANTEVFVIETRDIRNDDNFVITIGSTSRSRVVASSEKQRDAELVADALRVYMAAGGEVR